MHSDFRDDFRSATTFHSTLVVASAHVSSTLHQHHPLRMTSEASTVKSYVDILHLHLRNVA
jgi:hypothetical protein